MDTETEQCCKYIGRIRNYNTVNFKTKNILVHLSNEDGVKLYSQLTIRCNEKTGTTSFSVFGIKVNFKYNGKWKLNSISPTTNKLLRCTNQHTLDAFRRQRQYTKEKIERINFYTPIEKKAYLREIIMHNISSGSVTTTTVWGGRK